MCNDIAVLEDQDHLFLPCEFTRDVWSWAGSCFGEVLSRSDTVKQILRWACNRRCKDQRNQIILAAVMAAISNIWKMRNQGVLKNATLDSRRCITSIKGFVSRLSFLLNGSIHSSMGNLMVMRAFGVKPYFRKLLSV